MNGHPVGEAAAAHDAEHPVACSPGPDAFPGGGYHTGHLEARDVLRRARRRRVTALPLRHISPVHAREPGRYDDLVRGRNRVGAFGQPDNLVAASSAKRHSPHV